MLSLLSSSVCQLLGNGAGIKCKIGTSEKKRVVKY